MRVSYPQHMTDAASTSGFVRKAWQDRLTEIDVLMREMSQHTDPQEMVRTYGQRVRTLFGNDGFVAISRRGLDAPKYRITRSWKWTQPIDPWKEQHKLPLLESGLLGDLLYAGKPLLINDFKPDPKDPAFEHLDGVGSLLAVPHYENGESMNMVCSLIKRRDGFDPESVPEAVWISSLFGRATSNLVLSRQLGEMNAALDREMRIVADIQRSLLPTRLPEIKGLDLAAHYQTSKNAGGDYYDFFELEGGKLGMLIADVSGHGTPAAVLMAIMHAIAHVTPTDRAEPAKFLRAINAEISTRYAISTVGGTMFVTGFYAVYDPKDRSLVYSSAGHNPPRLRVGFVGPGGPVLELDRAQGLPLGILDDAEYIEQQVRIDPGDALILYTDGITETFSPSREMFGTRKLDEIISRPHPDSGAMLTTILDELGAFAENAPAADDRTIIIASAE